MFIKKAVARNRATAFFIPKAQLIYFVLCQSIWFFYVPIKPTYLQLLLLYFLTCVGCLKNQTLKQSTKWGYP